MGDAVFGPPLQSSVTNLHRSLQWPELFVLPLGYTLVTHQEFMSFVEADLCDRYRTDNYDIVSNNCNCFSDHSVEYLTGRSIPSEVLDLPKQLMNSYSARLLRPVLNKWLGGFGEGADNKSRGLYDCTGSAVAEPNLAAI